MHHGLSDFQFVSTQYLALSRGSVNGNVSSWTVNLVSWLPPTQYCPETQASPAPGSHLRGPALWRAFLKGSLLWGLRPYGAGSNIQAWCRKPRSRRVLCFILNLKHFFHCCFFIICLFLIVLNLHCCTAWAFSDCGEQGLLSSCNCVGFSLPWLLLL